MVPHRDALEGKGLQRRPQKRLGRRLEEVAKAVGGGYCRLQMPLRLALGVRETVGGHRLGALEAGGGGVPPPLLMHHWCPPPLCPDTGLSKHGDPVLWAFVGTIVFADIIQLRLWFVALCRLQEGSTWVPMCCCSCTFMCSCVLGWMLPCWTPFRSHEGVGLACVCNMCSLVRAAR